jgi:hypothetical protein
MKGKSILTFTVLLAVFGMAMAQDQLKLSVTAEKTEFLLGEPVIVYVTLINTGNEPIQVSSERSGRFHKALWTCLCRGTG